MMNRHILYIALSMVFLSGTFPKAAFSDVSANEQNSDVSITITKFQVNDQILELTYEIKNDSDHNVWICDRIDESDSRLSFEAYLAEDAKTLVIRKRLDVRTVLLWYSIPIGRYLRLQPGQEKTESLSLTVPVHSQCVYISEQANAERASRLVLEIGYYNEDLPDLIRSIIEVTERLDCEIPDINEDYYSDFFRCYFNGLLIPLRFGSLSHFDETYNSESEEFITAYTDELLGEQVLRATVDGVDIPYGEVSASDGPSQSETKPAGVTMSLTGFDVNDTNLELSYQIRNDSEQDIWICKYIDALGIDQSYQVFTTEDVQTLIARRRLEEMGDILWYIPPQSRYIRLRPGENRIESLSLTLPVESIYDYSEKEGNAARLIIEIGYYPGDLRGLICEILDVAEKMNWQRLYQIEYSHEIVESYFAGLRIAQWFGGIIPNASNEIKIPWMGNVRMGEKFLQLTIDGVRIPYKSPWSG